MFLSRDERKALWSRWALVTEAEKFRGVLHFDTGRVGPHLCITGSIHGNEAVGAVVIERLYERLQKGQLITHGRLSLILGNPDAFLDDVRYLDQDLNRAFADEFTPEQGEAQIDREGLRQLELKAFLDMYPVDMLLDLHSVSRGEVCLAVYSAQRATEGVWHSPLPLHFCYNEAHLFGRTLIDEIYLRGGDAMVVECGQHHSENTVPVALAHVQLMLEHSGLFTGSPLAPRLPQPEHLSRYCSTHMIAPRSGFAFTQPVETESFIEAGQVYATDDFEEHIASTPSWLMMPSLSVSPQDVDAGWLCTKERVSFPPRRSPSTP